MLFIRYSNVTNMLFIRSKTVRMCQQFGWTNATVKKPNRYRNVDEHSVELRSVNEPSAYWPFIDIRQNFSCTKIFDVVCEQQRMPTYCNNMKRNSNR